MTRFMVKYALILIIFISSIYSESEINIEKRQPTYGMAFEYGQIVKGEYTGPSGERDLNGATIPRLGIFFNQSASINDKLELTLGMGGLFFWVNPIKEGLSHTISAKFGPGISQTTIKYHFGELDDNNKYFKFGYFPIKYNNNASNLGEYLYRSPVYPGNLYSGGWWNINYALFYGLGFQFHWENFDGMITHDFSFLTEMERSPNFDLTPTYIGNLNIGKSLNIGAGVSFYHLIPMKPSLLTPKNKRTNIVTFADFPDIPLDTTILDGEVFYQQRPLAGGPQVGPEEFYSRYYIYRNGSKVRPFDEKIQTDVATGTAMVTKEDPLYIANPSNYTDTEIYRYARTVDSAALTHQGIKLMIKASLDFKPLFGIEDAMSSEDFKIFIEGAILGLQNQPYYFEKLDERMPIMFGVNLPTFGLFDIFSIQMEFYKSPWLNNSNSLDEDFLPIPHVEQPLTFEPITDDDWNWSFYVKKSVWNVMNFHLQIANDHLRVLDAGLGRQSYEPVIKDPKHWYYLLRFDITL